MAYNYGQGTSSSMSRDTIINLTRGPQDKDFKHGTRSLYAPKMWEKYRPSYTEYADFAPTTASPSLGNEVRWNIGDMGNLIERVELIWSIAACTKSGGTYVRACDYAGYGGLDYIHIDYGKNEYFHYEGIDCHKQHRLEHDQRQADAVTECVGGDLTTTQREALIGAVQTWCPTLLLPSNLNEFETDESNHIPVATLANDIVFTIRFHAASRFLETDGTSPSTTISGTPYLRVHYIQVHNEEQNELTSLTLRQGGLAYKSTNIERQDNEIVATASTSATIKLTNLNNPFYFLFFTVRKTAEVNAGTPFNYQAVSYFKLMDGNKDLTETEYHRYNLFKTKPRLLKGRVGDNIYVVPIGKMIAEHGACTGHYNPQQTGNLQLKIYWDSAISGEHRVDVSSLIHNIAQFKGGKVQRTYR